MSHRSTAPRFVLARAALAAGLACSATLAWAQGLPPGVEELARELEDDRIVKAPKKAEPPPTAIDKKAPSVRLPAQLAELQRLLAISDPDVAPFVRLAIGHVEQSLAAFHAGSRDMSLSHLDATLASMVPAQRALDDAVAAADPDDDVALIEVQRQLSLTAQRMAGDVVDQAQAVGVPKPRLKPARQALAAGDQALADGRHAVAVEQYAEGLGLGANTITFSVDKFETNIRAVFDPNAVGHAYTITQNGLVAKSNHFGLARTAADAPQTDQSDTKPMHIASASKLLSAIVTMRLLSDKGLTADAPIAPYLPSDWALGDGVGALTFADVMTHRTGFGQKNNLVQGEDYASLRARIALPLGDNAANYENANFALLRVLSSRLQNADPKDYPEFDAGALTAAMFIIKAKNLFASVGSVVDCHNEDPAPTIQYRFPDTGKKGYEEPPRDLTCGGYGFMTSPRDYTGLVVNLRYSSNLVPPPALADMRNRYLGMMSPNMFSSYTNGKFGVYHGHGGDWGHGAGGLDTCALMFPIVVEATVFVNSNAKSYGSSNHQCTALLRAFDDAWQPK